LSIAASAHGAANHGFFAEAIRIAKPEAQNLMHLYALRVPTALHDDTGLSVGEGNWLELQGNLEAASTAHLRALDQRLAIYTRYACRRPS